MDDAAFGTWLLEEGLLTPDELRRASNAQLGRQGRFDTEILDLQLLPEGTLLQAVGRFHRTRTVSGPVLEQASPAALRMLTPRIASRLGVVPFKLEGKTLSVATLSPGDLLVEDEIAQQTGFMVASFVTLEVRFVEALHRHYRLPITARYSGLIRRLSGGATGPVDGEASPRGRVVEPERPLPPVTGRAGGVVGDGRPSPAAGADDVLEISAEDLELFPSLRQGPEAPAVDSAASVVGVSTAALEAAAAPGADRPATELGPDDLLVAASLAMQNAEMRDDIADAMLGFCAPLFRRRMMLVLRGDAIIGWRGEGVAVDQKAVRALKIPAGDPSIFSGLIQGVEFWLGSLPDMPRNAELVRALGDPRPRDCYVMPVRLKSKVVCFLYGDNLDKGVGGLPIAALKRLAAKASVAFQVYLLKGKIRTL